MHSESKNNHQVEISPPSSTQRPHLLQFVVEHLQPMFVWLSPLKSLLKAWNTKLLNS